MTHGSLFSGIGGFDLAAEWVGWNNVFYCEWNEFAQQILKQYWPNSISYGDITKTDFSIHRGTIKVLSGGFPCQPYSLAGKQKGKEDERHLWPEMLRAIQEIQPRYIVGENVPGIISWSKGLVFDEIQTNLENEGYEVQPVILPACGINAPHRRDRVWFIAHNHKFNGNLSGFHSSEISQLKTSGIFKNNSANTNCNRLQGYAPKSQTRRDSYGSPSVERWENDPLEPIICRTSDGIPNRMDRIKALGNAIVPQVAYQIFKAIQEYENNSLPLTY